LELRGISSRAIERWTVKGSVGFIPALKHEAFSSILRNNTPRDRHVLGTVNLLRISDSPVWRHCS